MKQNITVVSLGPGDPGLLTAQSMNAMKKAKRLIFRTARTGLLALTEAGVQSTSLDDYYDRYEDFDGMHRDMAKALWAEAEHHAVVFAVLDAGTDGAVRELRAQQPQDAVLRILPGVTLADACIAQLPGNLAPVGALRTIPAEDAVTAAAESTTPLLITEIWNHSLACDLKLRLCDIYGDELPTVLFFHPPSRRTASRKTSSFGRWTACTPDHGLPVSARRSASAAHPVQLSGLAAHHAPGAPPVPVGSRTDASDPPPLSD